MKVSSENKFLITFCLAIIFISAVVYILSAYIIAKPLTVIGTVLLVLVLSSNDLYRLTGNKYIKKFIERLHVYGILSFLLIIPHTGQTGSLTESFKNGTADFSVGYLLVPTIAFLVLFLMAITSVQHYQPRWWKSFQRIIWLTMPLVGIHLIAIDWFFLGYISLIPIVLPFIGLLIDKKSDNKKIYLKQIFMLVISTIIIATCYIYPSIILFLLNFSFIFVPLILIGYGIVKIEDKSLRPTMIKWFVIAVFVISIILYTIS